MKASASLAPAPGRRFKVGDRVKILPVVKTPFIGLEGTVRDVLADHRFITTLDRYAVEFGWGETQSFYDVQLAAAPK